MPVNVAGAVAPSYKGTPIQEGPAVDRFAVNESRMLYFHRVVLDQVRRSPGLLERARTQLARLRSSRPDVQGLWDEWEGLLAGDFAALEAAVLAATPRGGLLRANSPMVEGLAPEERNALWQRVGLQQFVAYFMAAADDLGLDLEEQAAVAGLPAAELAEWRKAPPMEMAQPTLDALKRLVGLRHALEMLHPDRDARRAWLRRPDDSLATRPVDLLTSGGAAALHDALSAHARPLLGPGDLPRY